MEFNENRSARPFEQSPFRLIYQFPWRAWKAWRLRAQTRRTLKKLSPEQLRDIGLTREDVYRYK
ncbi:MULTISPECIES: DUF1127 domain-containing protein [Erwinia]|uniref:DUF1127 domain-containing protein n=1 Tax=Erwinia TaxID=551 RepID=UPI000550BC41|nr:MULTISPECIES: DUF1127 domain-containing protein [Erwinia]